MISMAKLSFSVLKIRSFRLLLLTRSLGTLAMQAQAVIVGWQIYSLTKSVFLLGVVGLTEAIPAITAALIAGHVVDIYSPKRVYTLCLGAIALNTVFLFAVGSHLIPLDQTHLILALFGGVFISGLARSFIRPANMALLPQVIGRSNVPSGTAWNTSFFQIATITAPALAGLIYGGYGAGPAWFFPMLMTTASAITSIFITVAYAEQVPSKRDPAWDSIKAGWQFLFTHPVLFPIMAVDMAAVLFGGATAMLPAFADQVLHTGSEGLGILRAAPAIGAVVVALFLATQPMRYISTKRLLWVIVAFGICIIGFGFSKIFWVSVVFLALSGAVDSVSMVIRQTAFQLLTPQPMMGRVSAVNGMFITSSNEIGSFESGTAASIMGLVPSVIFGGVCTVFIVGATALFAPKMRNTVIDTQTL